MDLEGAVVVDEDNRLAESDGCMTLDKFHSCNHLRNEAVSMNCAMNSNNCQLTWSLWEAEVLGVRNPSSWHSSVWIE